MKQGTLTVCLCGLALPGAGLAAVDYNTDVLPILKENCYECHGSKKKGDFRMDIEEEFKKHIGEDGNIIPGEPDKSPVIVKTTLPYDDEDRMPPPASRNQPLEPKQIAVLKTWIEEGASLEEGGSTTAASDPDSESDEAMDPRALHTWTSAEGSAMKAHFVRLEDDNVVLRSESGQEKAFPVKVFSEESKELIRKLSTQVSED